MKTNADLEERLFKANQRIQVLEHEKEGEKGKVGDEHIEAAVTVLIDEAYLRGQPYAYSRQEIRYFVEAFGGDLALVQAHFREKEAEDEAAAKKKAEDEAAAKKEADDESAAKKKADDEAAAKKEADDEAASKKKPAKKTPAKKVDDGAVEMGDELSSVSTNFD